MGGGTQGGIGAAGIVAAGTVYNPNYGKSAEDSIAKELEERKLLSPAPSTQAVAASPDQAPPTTTAVEVVPNADQATGVRR